MAERQTHGLDNIPGKAFQFNFLSDKMRVFLDREGLGVKRE